MDQYHYFGQPTVRYGYGKTDWSIPHSLVLIWMYVTCLSTVQSPLIKNDHQSNFIISPNKNIFLYDTA